MSALHANKRLQFGVSGFVVLAVLLATCTPASAYTETVTVPIIVDYPDSIAAMGDSITRAYNTGGTPFTDAPANSWSTGIAASVNSHYSRILHDHSPASGRNYNDAVTGAVMAGLNGQVGNAVSQGAQYVTILLGANDACTDTESQMTPVATYRSQFQAAMGTLSAGLPDTRIYVLSVPDIYNLWFILKDNASARFTWGLLGICQSMLANPQSQEPADVERRNRVRQRVVDYNTQLAQVCAGYIHCHFDNNAVFNTAFVPSDVSTRDYFHPAVAGHTKLAEVSYWAGFDFRDGVAPVSEASVSGPLKNANYLVTITARDNVGVAGTEYRIGGGPYTRYSGPVSLPAGSSFTYRSVDVNGTIEEARTISVGR
ncbi:MAG: GDSL-type esterase/lipase family protein [Chloroflexia bacterium]